MPLISWIIPVYNRGTLIKQCLQSVLSSTWSDYEIILVDDASTDQTGEICDFYVQQYDNVSCIHLTKNGGPGIARNVGINAAKGEWMFFLDSDDMICTDKVERLAEKLYGIQEEVDMVAFNILTEYNGECWDVPYYEKEDLLTKELFMLKHATQITVPAWNYLFRTRFIRDNGIIFQALSAHEDSIFILDCLYSLNHIYISTETLYIYRTISTSQDAQSLSKQNGIKYQDVALKMLFERICYYIRIYYTHKQYAMARILQKLLCQITIYMMPIIEPMDMRFKFTPDNIGVIEFQEDEFVCYVSNLFYTVMNRYKGRNIYIATAGIFGCMVADRLIDYGCNVLGFFDNYKSEKEIITPRKNRIPIMKFSDAERIPKTAEVLVVSLSYNHGKMKREFSSMGAILAEWYI